MKIKISLIEKLDVMVNKALITKIVDFSFVDGPGNRMTIFFQGCNFNCGYCHNPESIKNCNHCGICVDYCPKSALTYESKKVLFNEKECISCDKCIQQCPYQSTPKAKEMTVLEVLERINNVKDFIQGITISGGECTLQWEFIVELFEATKKETNLTTFIDSNGNIGGTALHHLLPHTDGFMLDIKGVTQKTHYDITEHSNIPVLSNIEKIYLKGKLYELRYVVVPNVNDGAEEVTELANIIVNLDSKIPLVLIPFRNFGVRGKYKDIESTSMETMNIIEENLRKKGLSNIVIKGK